MEILIAVIVGIAVIAVLILRAHHAASTLARFEAALREAATRLGASVRERQPQNALEEGRLSASADRPVEVGMGRSLEQDFWYHRELHFFQEEMNLRLLFAIRRHLPAHRRKLPSFVRFVDLRWDLSQGELFPLSLSSGRDGEPCLSTGERAFDERFCIQEGDAGSARAFFDEGVRRALLELQERIQGTVKLEVKGTGLVLRCAGWPQSVEEFMALVESGLVLFRRYAEVRRRLFER